MQLLATRIDDGVRRHEAILRLGPQMLIDARWVGRSVNLAARCGRGLRCRREEAKLPSIFSKKLLKVILVQNDHLLVSASKEGRDTAEGDRCEFEKMPHSEAHSARARCELRD
jgi:hypothetical protein